MASAMSKELNDNDRDTPTFRETLVFRAKATHLQLRRAVDNSFQGGSARFPIRHGLPNEVIIAESRTRLWADADNAEKQLLAGKIHNLRLALRRLNGAEVPAGNVFSFWAQIGRATRRKGYVPGRELREGCIIPSIGGGLCQLSNALYDAALSAGFEIVERHAHTQIIPGSLAENGRDATVFWNYVDLRFKSSSAFRIEAIMDADHLIVRFRSNVTQARVQAQPQEKRPNAMASVISQSCDTCSHDDCFRHVERKAADFGRSAYLVDEYYPEFNEYLREVRGEQDLLAIPLDGKRYGKGNYAWSTDEFRDVRQSAMLTLLRAYQSRKLALQGAARQRALLAYSERLAQSYSALLKHDITHITVSQNLLPFLWRNGCFGGRTFDVLMTAMPLARLHERLDTAFALHPESNTLSDFRADEWLVRAENEALECARKIITPHSEIAGLYANKVTLLDWTIPEKLKAVDSKRSASQRFTIAFPSSTIGRKGAYELRAAVQGLDVKIFAHGPQLEGAGFWRETVIENRSYSEDWLRGVDVVVLPAFVEHKPRRLLEAIARGIPVIASIACGLLHVREVINIPIGEVDALRAEIKRLRD